MATTKLFSAEDVAEKVKVYLDAGVAIVWVVDPRKKTVIVLRFGRTPRHLSVDDELDGEEILPGFTLPVADVFSNPW